MVSVSEKYEWKVVLGKTWDILGPFPIHAREQHYLSPSFPLNLSDPINFEKSWPSSYADGGRVSWSKTDANPDGTLKISFPDIRWKSLRSTEGWAALQHHAVLRTSLTVYPPTSGSVPFPHLFINLIQGSFFTIIPNDDIQRKVITSEWFSGNIYDMERALPRRVNLPTPPSLTQPTTYDVIVSGDYEIRLFGDPTVQGQGEVPVQTIKFELKVENSHDTLVHEPTQDVISDFVEGIAFGTALGIGIRSLAGWWAVKKVTAKKTKGLVLQLQRKTSIAPSQMRIIPLLIVQETAYDQPKLQIELTLVSNAGVTKVLNVVLDIRHLSIWTVSTYSPITATYFYSNSMPTAFVVVPPIYPNPREPWRHILALHGAGVDILQQRFWIDSFPRNKHSWIIAPTGRTSWGLDWHGPSARDAWASVDALSSILRVLWGNASWTSWETQFNSPVVILGHSNGGQGAWYLASRYPDRVLGVVPAAGYIKSQAYVPLSMSRSAHYIDPALRSILESSLTPDDNDLHLPNLARVPVLAIHGGDDENVPVWHSREAVSILEANLSGSKVTFREDAKQGHWYPSVFDNEQVAKFLEKILKTPQQLPRKTPKEFTLTVSSPSESGSLYGWKIESLLLPGRLSRLHIQTDELGLTTILTSNVRSFSVDRRVYQCTFARIDDPSRTRIFPLSSSILQYFTVNDGDSSWKVTDRAVEDVTPSRMQDILTSPGPIIFVVPDVMPSRELSVALRIAHDLNLYHRLDAEIILESKALSLLEGERLPCSNLVFIGTPASSFAWMVLDSQQTPFGITKSSFLELNGQTLDDPNTAAMFMHPHPMADMRQGLYILFILSGSISALERATRLFPIRTGVAVPSWVVTTNLADKFGAAGIRGAGVWGPGWSWNQALSMWML